MCWELGSIACTKNKRIKIKAMVKNELLLKTFQVLKICQSLKVNFSKFYISSPGFVQRVCFVRIILFCLARSKLSSFVSHGRVVVSSLTVEFH
jgi:hypothetical protein